MILPFLIIHIHSMHASSLTEASENFSKLNFLSFSVGEHSFYLPAGRYRISCYGGQGGGAFLYSTFYPMGGKGAYVSGYINITGSGQLFYAVVGSEGTNRDIGLADGGFNGGGTGGYCLKWFKNLKRQQYQNGPGGGGGATDIRINSNNINNRIIVAAGGSGSSVNAGGAPGGDLTGYNYWGRSTQTTQTSGNLNGIGSAGGNAKKFPASGAGGGYRGGIGGVPNSSDPVISISDSGSSYISGYEGCTPHPSIQFDSGVMQAGAHEHNGYAQIDQVYECPPNCFSCSSSTQCDVCNSTYRLYEGTCILECPKQTIDRETRCDKCDDSCKSCDIETSNCTDCFDGFYHYKNQCLKNCPPDTSTLDDECFDTCPNGTYKNGTICDICDPICSKCTDNPTKCTGCPDGKFILNNDCIEKCPDKFYNDGSECVLDCKPGQFLYDSICYDICPAGTYPKGLYCELCDSSCSECSNNATTCVNCNEGLFLFDSKCLENCPENYFEYENSCLTSCPNFTFINDNECVENCPYGKFIVGQKCKNCDSSCFTCDNSSTFCTSCSSQRYLYNNQCLTECINGTVIYQNECVSVCPSGSYLDGNVCQLPVEYYGIVEITNKKPKIAKSATTAVLTILIILFIAEIGFLVYYFFGDKIKLIFKSLINKNQQKSEDENE